LGAAASGKQRNEGGGMSAPINVRDLAPGTSVVLVDGAVAEIVTNPGDGMWLFARYLSSPRDPALVGQEEMIFAPDVVAVGDQRMVRP
jgi:hypothetical protein